jgi:glycosyltransferase involved in cell wall biosynthesis
LKGTTLLSVGNLVANKGHDISLKALSAIPDATLVIIGDGIEKNSLIRLARDLGHVDRVRILPAMPQTELAEWYAAADVLVLATEREGIPNVIFEALACGTPVVATEVGGIGEVVTSTEAGILMRERSPEALADAVRRIVADPPSRSATSAYAKRFDWKNTTSGQQRIFDRILSTRRERSSLSGLA